MARPQRIGIDYFALDVKMDDEVAIIEAEYGLEGFAVLIKLFQKIYSEGYFYEWTEREQILFNSRVSVDRNKLLCIVNDCVKWGIFNERLFKKYNILTSKRIQTHYFTSTYKRSGVEAIEEYLLIDLSGKTNITMMRVTDDGNEATSNVSAVQSTQSKVKESKVKKSKVKNSSSTTATDNNIFREYENCGFGLASSTQAEMLMELEKNYGSDWVVEALKESAKNNVLKISYAEAILKNWGTNGRSKKNELGREGTADHQKQEGSYATEVNLDDYDESLFDGLI